MDPMNGMNGPKKPLEVRKHESHRHFGHDKLKKGSFIIRSLDIFRWDGDLCWSCYSC